MKNLELKFNRFTRISIELFFGIMPLIIFGDNIYRFLVNHPVYLTKGLTIVSMLMFLVTLILHFSAFPNFKIVITDMGIEKHHLVQLGPLILFQKHYKFEWNAINSFERYNEGLLYCFLAKGDLNGKEVYVALINIALTNSKLAVKEIANRLPQNKVNANVWPYIKKWEVKGQI